MPSRALCLLVAIGCLVVTSGVGASAAAPAAPEHAVAAKKKPLCKRGVNKKPCRCKKGSSLKRNKKGSRCRKKPAAKPPTPGTDQTVTTPPAGGGTEPVPAASAEPVRNDQALLDALTNAAFYKTYSGGGFGSYAYNFLPTVLGEVEGRAMFSLRYCTYYYAVGFTADRSNYNGVWLIKEGFTHPAEPGLITGVVQLFRQDMPQDKIVEAAVAVKDGNAAIKTGDGSTWFEPGEYSYRPGQATTDCETWVPA